MKQTNILVLAIFIIFFPMLSSASIKIDKNNFLVISDIHLNHASSHTMDISPSQASRENDLDQETFKKLISEIHSNINKGFIKQPKFIMILGDITGHQRSSSDNVLINESIVFNLLKKQFPSTPIFYTFGNNDSLAANYGPFKDLERSDAYKSPYDVAKINGGWLGGYLSTGVLCKNKKNKFPCIITEDTNNGYYSAYLDHKLRLISLNSVLFSPNRIQITQQDAINQLQWLNSQLKTAQTNQESVLIAMHVPPGNNIYDHSTFMLPTEQAALLKIINTYQDTIIGLLVSHTHAEELKVIKDARKHTIGAIYFTAALSTSHGNEPSVKTFYYSNTKGQWFLSNYTAFHFSLDNSELTLNKLYDFETYYCEPNNENGLSHCLSKVTAEKMKTYYSAGNKNYGGIMQSPEDITIFVNE